MFRENNPFYDKNLDFLALIRFHSIFWGTFILASLSDNYLSTSYYYEHMEFPQGPVCQSCGMPLRKDEDFGTNRDGSRSEEYCFHCFLAGTFLDEGITLQEKIEKKVKFGVQMGMPEDRARHMCETVLPHLKRWQNK